MKQILSVYNKLLAHFGSQNWWPMENSFTPREWEVCVGAVLTQNTSWSSVEKALKQMNNSGCKDVHSLMNLGLAELENMIRSSGFYRQKAKRLKILGSEVVKFGSAEKFLSSVSREHLLGIEGIGPETADSILLYACNKPYFVVDAYTKRVFSRLGILEENTDYETIRGFFEENLPKDVNIYKEFHALIVKVAKEHCRSRPSCAGCPLRKDCRHFTSANAR